MHVAVGIGVLWGIFCGVANGWPIASTLAQMAVPWLWVAALVAYRRASSARQAALLGGTALLAANIAYFAVGVLSLGLHGLSPFGGVRFFLLWTALGLVAGPAAGLVGWWASGDHTAMAAIVAVAAFTVAEPLALWAHIDHLDAHVAYVGVAVAGIALALFRFRHSWRRAVGTITLTLLLAYPAAVALEAALIALGQVSPPMRLV